MNLICIKFIIWGIQSFEKKNIMVIRAALTWLSKVICIYFGFALQHSVIGKKLVPLSEPIRSETKTNGK